MTKRILIGTCVVILFITGIFLYWKKDSHSPVAVRPVPSSPKVIITSIDSSPNSPAPALTQDKKREPASAGYANVPSDEWETRLTTSFQEQAGPTLKEIKIVKERTLIWKRDNIPLHVNSINVTLTSNENVKTSFRALVDSQTGKVLETWDRTISDPANVRGGFRFKLDPRYSN